MNRLFFQRFARPIIVAVAILIPLTGWAAMLALATNKNDVAEWLPASFEATQEYHWFQKHFGNETFILASWDGCTVDDERLDTFAKHLSPATTTSDVHYFDMVITTREMLDRLTTPPTSLSRDEALQRIKGSFVGNDLKHACAALRLSPEGNERLREAVAEVYAVAVDRVGIPREQIHLGGPPVDNATIDAEGERMLPTLTVLCSVVGLSLAWWYLRDVRLTLMVFVGGAYCGALGMALVYVLGGRMDSVLLTMPAVVYTAGLSAAIHLVNYYRHVRAQEGLEGAAERGLKAAWIPCLLSAGTTSLGLISLCTSDLVPIRNFGFYTALGVMCALGFVFLYLPSALQIWPPQMAARDNRDHDALDPQHRRRMRTLAKRLTAHPLVVWGVFAAVGIFCGSGLYKVKTTINLMSLFPADAEIIQSYRYLEDKIGPLVPMEVVVHLDKGSKLSFLDRLQLIGRIQDEIEKIPHVGSVTSAATYTPSLTAPKSGGLRGVLVNESTYRNILNRRLVAHREDFVRDGYIADDTETGEELWRVSMRVAALAGVDYGAFIEDIRQRVEPQVAKERKKTPEISRVTYTGMTAVVYMAERSLLNGLVKSFFEAFVMMAIIMSFVFRDIRAGLYTMLPNVWPMAVVFGLMSWFNIALDIGTMMTASVAMGVCVDDMVHFANWFRRASRLGLNHHDAAVLAFENSAGAIYQSTMIVALGLVTFGLSTFMPTRRFGLLMCTLLFCGLVADLGLSPAMLAGRIGRYFTVGARPKKPPGSDEETGPEGLREDEGSLLAQIDD